MMIRLSRILLAAGALAALSGCNTVDRLQDVGKAPATDPITNPVTNPSYQPVTMPMPSPPGPRAMNSLWQPGARSFFHDPRAGRVGDILTVNITIADAAKLSNTTSRSRTNSDDANLTNFFGLEGELASALPSGADPASLVKMGSDLSNVGAGSVNRSENINLTLAAVVTQVLPNGNLVISGSQQVLVNDERRDLEISGMVRTEDITNANTVDLSQIAEARLSYGGKGQITDVQQPRWGDQLLDIFMPW